MFLQAPTSCSLPYLFRSIKGGFLRFSNVDVRDDVILLAIPQLPFIFAQVLKWVLEFDLVLCFCAWYAWRGREFAL